MESSPDRRIARQTGGDVRVGRTRNTLAVFPELAVSGRRSPRSLSRPSAGSYRPTCLGSIEDTDFGRRGSNASLPNELAHRSPGASGSFRLSRSGAGAEPQLPV